MKKNINIPRSFSVKVFMSILNDECREKWNIIEPSAFIFVCKDVKIRKNASQKTIDENSRIIATGLENIFRKVSKYFMEKDTEFFEQMAIKLSNRK